MRVVYIYWSPFSDSRSAAPSRITLTTTSSTHHIIPAPDIIHVRITNGWSQRERESYNLSTQCSSSGGSKRWRSFGNFLKKSRITLPISSRVVVLSFSFHLSCHFPIPFFFSPSVCIPLTREKDVNQLG